MRSYNKIKRTNPFVLLNISIYILSAACLMVYITQQSYAHADDEDLGYDIKSADASVTVGTACTFTATVDSAHNANIANGIYSTNIGKTTLNTICNDSGGYAVYAIGYTGDEYGATNLSSDISSTYNISTGTNTSGDSSSWAMKLAPEPGTTTATIENGYNNYSIVPDDYTKVATLNTITDNTSTSSVTGSSISTTYQTYISPTQPAGTYSGKVKYTLVHPSTAPAPKKPIALYNAVKSLVKKDSGGNERTQTLADMQADITAPTTTDPATDTSNSGVYKYDAATFGIASDASNDYNIYYYRGILEPEADQGEYGSDGQATTYPNYVKLGNNTCWRIVRTTGSGGVKMIYNGMWTGSTCANNTTNAQLTDRLAFASRGTSSQSKYWYKNIHYVGYTYNNNVTDSTATTSVDTVFGSDTNPNLNNTRSNTKTYIEDTWYANNMTSYTNILEPSAGYCNDRTAYSDRTTSVPITDIAPYKTSGVNAYFGAYGRNQNATNAGKTPSLSCPRSTVDLYRYVPNSVGLANELKYPAALFTADEMSFAGSGSDSVSGGSSHNDNSFLYSGDSYWLLSPDFRDSNDVAYGYYLYLDGTIDSNVVDSVSGVRPSISLKSGVIAISGSGTATDPWTINE